MGNDRADHAVLGGDAHEPVHLGHLGTGGGVRFDMYGSGDIDAFERGPVVLRSIPLPKGVESFQPGIAQFGRIPEMLMRIDDLQITPPVSERYSAEP